MRKANERDYYLGHTTKCNNRWWEKETMLDTTHQEQQRRMEMHVSGVSDCLYNECSLDCGF